MDFVKDLWGFLKVTEKILAAAHYSDPAVLWGA